MAYTYRLVDVVREYSHAFLRGPTNLMATLVFDPPGRELFEHWHYEIFHLEDRAGLPAVLPDMYDSGGRDGSSFYDLQGTEAFCVAEEHVAVLMAREYVQLSTFMASESDFHGLRALLCNRDWIFAQYVRRWTPQPPVPLCNNTANDAHMKNTTGMSVGAHALHFVYMQGASFLRARRMLMHDLGKAFCW